MVKIMVLAESDKDLLQDLKYEIMAKINENSYQREHYWENQSLDYVSVSDFDYEDPDTKEVFNEVRDQLIIFEEHEQKLSKQLTIIEELLKLFDHI